jgi:amidase
VASGALAIAHASDGGGSTRVPAAYQGLVGMKPTRGRVSDGPGVSDPNGGMSAHLACTRTVRDTAAVLDVLSGPAIGDPHLAPVPVRPFLSELGLPVRKMRFAMVLTPPDNAPVAPEILAATRKAATLLESMGHVVEEATLPLDGEAMLLAIHTIWSAGMANGIDHLAAQLGRTPSLDNLTRTTFNTYLEGKSVTASQFIDGLGEMNMIRRQMGAFFKTYDAILSPSTSQLAQAQEMQDQHADYGGMAWTRYMFSPDLFNPLYNITGNPAISLPLYQTGAGAQIGIQLVTRFGEDGMLLRLAAELEQAQPWAGRRPPVHVCNDLSGFDRVRKGRR